MKNTIKKLALIIATAAVVFTGAANVYAGVDHIPSTLGEVEYKRFLEVETGN